MTVFYWIIIYLLHRLRLWRKMIPKIQSHATTRFLRKGGAKAPPLLFKGGAFLRKGGAKFFSSVHLPRKLILHHIDTFVMQVSWIGSKQSNVIIIIFIIITMIFYSMIYDWKNMKSPEEEVLPILAHRRRKILHNLWCSEAIWQRVWPLAAHFWGGQWSKFGGGGGGPKHTLAHPLKFLGGHGPPVPPSLLTSHHTIFINLHEQDRELEIRNLQILTFYTL